MTETIGTIDCGSCDGTGEDFTRWDDRCPDCDGTGSADVHAPDDEEAN